tara:strand:- start:404 stop:1480 length:1077 start_codon:yes stop_codon:yes gene_type:complete
MNLNSKFDLYCWACDFSPKRGEGILARHYIQKLSKVKNKKFHIKSPDGIYTASNGIIKKKKINNKNLSKLNLSFMENYFNPLIGIIYLWVNYFKSRGVCYLNFLPLWNTILFIFLPPKTHLGPITGFIFKKKIKGFNSFLRKYLNNFLFNISTKFLFLRQNKIYFSTDLLKPLVNKANNKKAFFNYLINLVKINRYIKKKKYDFLIYNRNYSVKNNILRNRLLKIILSKGFKIMVVGDQLTLKGVKNLGYLSREKTNLLLERTKFVINSGENPYNIFTIDAFNNHSNIIYEDIFLNKISYFNKEKLFYLNFKSHNKVLKFLNKKNFTKISKSKLTKNYRVIQDTKTTYFKTIELNYTH